MFIYKIVCKINNKIYIGQTTETLEKRFKRHMTYQKDMSDTKFYRAVKKYGVENFYIELVDTASSKEELDTLEEYYIKYYNCIEYGYNTALGKIGGDTLSKHPNLDNIRKKLSESKKGHLNPNATKVKAINLNTNETYIFGSVKECQLHFNIPRHDIIIRRCKNEIKKPYNNYLIFEYI